MPRRKTTKAEIKLDYPVPKPATMEFKTEMAHRVEAPPKLATQRSEVTFPVSAPPSVDFRWAFLSYKLKRFCFNNNFVGRHLWNQTPVLKRHPKNESYRFLLKKQKKTALKKRFNRHQLNHRRLGRSKHKNLVNHKGIYMPLLLE